jgi:hypothetical protein
MKMMWCWRCKMALPMLDEEEFSIVSNLYSQGTKATKEFRERHNIPLSEASIEDRFRPVREAYQRLTGWREQPENAVMHHRISIYGPPCTGCGKPLRTPRASFCAACGKRVSNSQEASQGAADRRAARIGLGALQLTLAPLAAARQAVMRQQLRVQPTIQTRGETCRRFLRRSVRHRGICGS